MIDVENLYTMYSIFCEYFFREWNYDVSFGAHPNELLLSEQGHLNAKRQYLSCLSE
jgi:hypothetical protein